MSRKLYVFKEQQFEIKRHDELKQKLNKIHVVKPSHGKVQDRSS